MQQYDVLVIGAGPAGISAAVYAASRGKQVGLFEAQAVGGMIGRVSTVTHYASVANGETGAQFARRLEEQAIDAGIGIIRERVVLAKLTDEKKSVTTTAGKTFGAPRIVLANGLKKRELGIPGEKLACKSAQFEAGKFQGKNVYVIGGADGAVKEALYLARFAKKVSIICVEDELACISQFKEPALSANNIEIIPASRVTALDGKGLVERLHIESLHSGQTTEINDLGCGVFIFAGGIPDTALYTGQIELNNEFIQVNEEMATSLPGVWAAGDIRVKQVRQVATAVADGAIAGINATR